MFGPQQLADINAVDLALPFIRAFVETVTGILTETNQSDRFEAAIPELSKGYCDLDSLTWENSTGHTWLISGCMGWSKSQSQHIMEIFARFARTVQQLTPDARTSGIQAATLLNIVGPMSHYSRNLKHYADSLPDEPQPIPGVRLVAFRTDGPSQDENTALPVAVLVDSDLGKALLTPLAESRNLQGEDGLTGFEVDLFSSD